MSEVRPITDAERGRAVELSAAERAQVAVENALAEVESHLADARAQRDALNDDIRDLVAERETLRQARRPFVRKSE